MGIFIDDGFTQTKTIPAEPGLHSGAEVVYRPALARARTEYSSAVSGGSPARLAAVENEILVKHVVTVEGHKLDADKAARLVPALRSDILDLVLGYKPGGAEAEAAAAKN